MDPQFKYRAFISYSHSDESWAKWLHKSLETYRVPKHLVGRQTEFGPVPERLAPVFRDRDELATATNLGATLTRALEQSAFQVVICSPAAAQSRWVNEEVLAFKRLGREQRIFCLIVSGEPGASAAPETAQQECFPNALIFRMGADGQLTAERTEPIAADARPQKDSRQDARLKLVAGMLGVGLDELKQREAHRRQRRLMVLVAASVAGMAITSGLAAAAWFARNQAERERVRAESEAETARQTTRFMVDLFKVSDPSGVLGNRITARAILDTGARRIDQELLDQPAIQATLMDTMGTVYTSLGLYGSALPLIRKALDQRRSLFGARDAAVAQSLNNLGEVLALKSDYQEAEQRLREALVIRRALLGDVHPDVAATCSALADVYFYTGEHAKGEPLIREALRIRRTLYGEVHPAVAESLADLGTNYGNRGDFPQAEVYLREALALQRKLHPTVHPDLAEAMNNLASVLLDLNQPIQAEPLYRQVLAMHRQLYGDAHPVLANGLNNLGYVLEIRGNYRGAESAYRESLAMKRKLLGDSHPLIADGMSNLGFVLYRKGDRQGGIELLRDALKMRRQELGAEHPDVAGGAGDLAYLLIESGEYQEADPLVDESLIIGRKLFGNEDPRVGGTLVMKASLLAATGHYLESQQAVAEAKRIFAGSLPEDHWLVAWAKSVEGAALTGLREYQAAEPLLLQSVDGLKDSPLPGLPASGRIRLAELYTAWGKPEQALKFRSN
jgi:tetratricopeptide (TPR) repeat protein